MELSEKVLEVVQCDPIEDCKQSRNPPNPADPMHLFYGISNCVLAIFLLVIPFFVGIINKQRRHGIQKQIKSLIFKFHPRKSVLSVSQVKQTRKGFST